MSTPQERIETEVREALKARQKERLSTLRMLLNTLKNERIRTGQEVDEATFLKLVRKSIKQRQESSQQFRQGGRQELAEKEDREADILTAYLPPAVDDDLELTRQRSANSSHGGRACRSTGLGSR